MNFVVHPFLLLFSNIRTVRDTVDVIPFDCIFIKTRGWGFISSYTVTYEVYLNQNMR